MHTGGRRGEKEAEGVKEAKKYEGDEEGRNRVMGERGTEAKDGEKHVSYIVLDIWFKIYKDYMLQIPRDHSNCTDKMH